jgi:catechol 2,3-dioxygenase-like lactoylglutathione lyase family enzyme
MATIEGVLESVLYADDLDAAHAFYSQALGLASITAGGLLSRAYRIAPNSVLLVFDPNESGASGRALPPHGARGPGHLAMRIPEGEVEAWRARLTEHGLSIEHEEEWDTGHHSVYVRDPAGNSIELVTGDLWPDGVRPSES